MQKSLVTNNTSGGQATAPSWPVLSSLTTSASSSSTPASMTSGYSAAIPSQFNISSNNNTGRSIQRDALPVELDPRRRELLESRMDARFGNIGFLSPEFNTFGNQSLNDNSNLSGGSQHSDNADIVGPNETPEKARTPSGGERKRKRKNPELQDGNSGHGSTKSNRNNDTSGKKINEYFKMQSGSPGRGTQVVTAKSPSPQAVMSMFPPSPNQNYGGSNQGSDFHPPRSPSMSFISKHQQLCDKVSQTDLTCIQLQSTEGDLKKKKVPTATLR